MGKVKPQAVAEVKKSAAYCRYYADNADKFLKPERVPSEAKSSYVSLEPLGPVYVISPFNFPFWLGISI
jgi:acyl-CoA reductase-like NAD-dependent aldehyde dehydrogenase